MLVSLHRSFYARFHEIPNFRGRSLREQQIFKIAQDQGVVVVASAEFPGIESSMTDPDTAIVIPSLSL